MKRLIVFTGAGMSAESGIPTFRGSDGLWENFRIEDVATPEAWAKNPDLVMEFYNQRRKGILESQPNAGHMQIARWQDEFDVTVVTQNIDDLHERAGSADVLHLHGNIRQSKSSGPNQEKAFYAIDGWELKNTDLCPDGFVLRPHVVWFGEEVPMYDVAMQHIAEADILVVIGTSLQVYPAAGLIHYALNAEARYLIDPNAGELNVPKSFKVIPMNAVEGMKKLMEELS